ncbi:MAG: PSD1 and planctomycete cytochrome C domain-containing protein [Pyrinomonadaceae bacterium]
MGTVSDYLKLSAAIALALVGLLTIWPHRGAHAAIQAIDESEFFETRVRPVLANNCYSCHAASASGGLKLDARRSVLEGGSRGPAIVPGKPEDSLLMQAVAHTHDSLRMPLGGAKLKDEEIAALAKWIKDGAFWPETNEEFFAARVKPLLTAKCVACHGPESPQRNLRLDSREAIIKGGASGPAVVPGDPDKSLLVASVRYTHNRYQMPPGGKLSEREVADLEKWVKNGAAWSAASAETTRGEYVISHEQKSFWSFQPLKMSPAPATARKEWSRNPVDRFILAKLEEKDLTPAERTDKLTLIRRATYDLTGLPPTPAEIKAFAADHSPRAFAKVVDRLLASPRYGERWGRHWLDLVRYADSAGDSSDYPVPQAYLYRDYVIDSLNRDKPYRQFVREQIAGDLLPAKTESQKWEQTVATGYLALSRRFSVRPELNMYLTIDDTIDNVGKSFLGLTVGCARCHDHKYDPIAAKDYYALYGIFDSTRFPFAGSENTQEQQDLVTRLPPAEVDQLLKPFREQMAPLEAQLKKLQNERMTLNEETGEAKEAPAAPAAKRTLKQIEAEIKTVKQQRREIMARMPALEKAFAVAEGKPHNARVLRRGDPKNLGDEVPRRFLQILGGRELPDGAKTSGRLQLADWLTDAQNPLAARVMVNRIWQQHFGKGLVSTPSDFGKRGKAPTHPELLDYLALNFIESNWSLKAMHRLMMLSETYQLASDGAKRNFDKDPSNDYLWKFNRRRLDAEEIRDSLLAMGGHLDFTKGDAHPFPHESKWKYTQHAPFADVYDTDRRSVYLMTQRIQRHPFLAIFDGADTNSSTAARVASTTPIQALYMMNSQFMHEQAEKFAQRVASLGHSDGARVMAAYRIALGRDASPEERQRADEYLRHSREKLSAAKIADDELPTKTLASFLRVLLSSNEFIYVD